MVDSGSWSKLGELFEDLSVKRQTFPDEQCAAQNVTVCSGNMPGTCWWLTGEGRRGSLPGNLEKRKHFPTLEINGGEWGRGWNTWPRKVPSHFVDSSGLTSFKNSSSALKSTRFMSFSCSFSQQNLSKLTWAGTDFLLSDLEYSVTQPHFPYSHLPLLSVWPCPTSFLIPSFLSLCLEWVNEDIVKRVSSKSSWWGYSISR